jgi:hypothetical protein
MRWEADGWTERDWTRIDATAEDLRCIASEFDASIGAGGGAFEPAEVRGFADRLRVIVSRLDDIERKYV